MPSAGRPSRVFCTNQPLPHAYVFVRHGNVRFAVAILAQASFAFRSALNFFCVTAMAQSSWQGWRGRGTGSGSRTQDSWHDDRSVAATAADNQSGPADRWQSANWQQAADENFDWTRDGWRDDRAGRVPQPINGKATSGYKVSTRTCTRTWTKSGSPTAGATTRP